MINFLRLKQISVLFIALFIGSFQNLSAQELIDKVAAQIGSEYILLSDVQRQFAFVKDQQGAGELDDDQRCQILESLIAQKVMIHQSKLDSIVVTSDEIDQQLDYRIATIMRQMNGNEDLFKEVYGQTIEEVKVWMRGNIEDMMLAERMQMSILNSINITPSETRAFFNKIDPDSLPYFNAEVEVAEIVAIPEVNKEERQKALDQALLLRKSIVDDGEDFAELAEKYSDDAGSKRLGGDLGWQKRGTFVPEFQAEAYSLKKGQISMPIETQFGFHIIELLGRRGNSVHTRHILITPEITSNDIELAKERLTKYKGLIDGDSISFEKAIKKYGYKEVESYNNNGRLVNSANGTTFFETAALPPDIYFAIEGLKVGDITEPIEYLDERTNDTRYRIIKLLSKTKPHKANLQDDYSKIQFFAKENKKNEYFSEWITSKIKNTYMKLDADYKTCPNFADWELN